MRLPSYNVIRVPARTRGSVARRLKYASKGNPARGPAYATTNVTLLTGTSTATILTGSNSRPWERWTIGAGLGRLERGLAALRGESSPPVPLSATRRGGTRD